MYVEIKEDKLLSWCEKPYLDYKFVNIDYNTFEPEKYSIVNDELVDISNTQEYSDKVSQREKEVILADVRLQLEEFDKKRIRALAEPGFKDVTIGLTWIEYYNEQINLLRGQIASL